METFAKLFERFLVFAYHCFDRIDPMNPNYRIIRRAPSRYLHYYFYIRDPAIGPLAIATP